MITRQTLNRFTHLPSLNPTQIDGLRLAIQLSSTQHQRFDAVRAKSYLTTPSKQISRNK
jgi:hypothetical protein